MKNGAEIDKMPGRPNNGPLSPAERLAFRDLEIALNRRVAVEEVLNAVAIGKRDMLTREECRELAAKLGSPLSIPTTKPFAYTTRTSLEIMRADRFTHGSFSLFLPFEGMDEIEGVEFIPLYAAPQPAPATDERQDYLVWSNEHRAWWRANSCGYARSILEAGRYTRAEAVDIADKSRNGWKLDQRPDEIAVAIADLPPPIRAALTKQEGSATLSDTAMESGE